MRIIRFSVSETKFYFNESLLDFYWWGIEFARKLEGEITLRHDTPRPYSIPNVCGEKQNMRAIRKSHFVFL